MGLTVHWRALKAVLKDAWPVWLSLIGLIFAFTAGWLLSTTLTAAVRYTGTMLQILGLFTVAYGFRQTRRMFDQPSLRASMLNWFRRLAAAFTAAKPISVGRSLAFGWNIEEKRRVPRELAPGATLDERVSLIEENLNLLGDEVDTKFQGVHRELGTLKQSIELESEGRREADEKTARKIEGMAIGGLHLEVVGLFWLFLGVIAAGIPDVIAAWLSGIV